jgi:hypothetical protein
MAYPTSGLSGAFQMAGVTSTPTQATTAVACIDCIVQNDPGSPANAIVGGSDAQFLVIQPGQTVTIQVPNTAQIYVKSASGAQNVTINFQPRS